MQIAVISDTHLPRGDRRLPEACRQRCRDADLVIHAGDFTRLSVLRELEDLGRVRAVHGNVDEARLRSLLPERAVVQAAGVTIAIVHDAGPAGGRLARLRAWFPDAHAVIFGHSHLPLHAVDAGEFQIFNPGSPTDRRWAPRRTMGLATIAGLAVTFELIALD